MKQMLKRAIVGIKAIVSETINAWPKIYPIKLKSKPTMASPTSYLEKFILVSAKQNLSPGTTTIQCHLETGQQKQHRTFEIYFEFKRSK